MDIYQLRYFLALVETNNFSRAAERAFVSQPTLSTGIKKLETELGLQLFSRESRTITLTEAGHRFLPRARTIIHEVNAAKQEVNRKTPVLRLQIGVLRGLPTNRLAKLLRDFNQSHPDVQASLKEGTLTQLHSWLDEQRIDIAFSTPLDEGHGGEFERLYSWKFLLSVPADHTFASRSSVPLKRLDRLDFIHRTHCESGTDLTRTFVSAGVNPHIVFRTDQDNKALSLIGAGLGLCMMPDIHVAPDVVQVPVDGINIGRTIGLIWYGTRDNELIQSFRLFAASNEWRPARTAAKNLDWAR
ncbi:MAG: LysR family transcriptional regulator [Sneathiella sp.]